MSKIPHDATPSVQDAFRQLYQRLDQLAGPLNVDLKGRRLINAGASQGPLDYVTRADLEARLSATVAATVPAAGPIAIGSTVTPPPSGLTPSAPTGLFVVVNHNPDTFGLGWDNPPPGETVDNYLVGEGTTPGSNDILYSGIASAVPGYSASANGANFMYIRVYAANGANISPPSNEVVAVWNGVPPPPPPGGGGPPPTGGTNLDLSIGQPGGIPGKTLLWFRGNMCGVRVAGLPAIAGGAADTSLVLSWFWPHYSPTERADIILAWLARGYSHVLLSWPDSRARGMNAAAFVVACQELAAAGLYPVVFLSSKDFDAHDAGSVVAAWGGDGIIGALTGGGFPWVACVGWELSLWLSPTDVQILIDYLASVLGGVPLFVHFQEDYIAFQQPGGTTSDFWNANIGKLTGLLHQKALYQDTLLYQQRIDDGLTRFAGNAGFAASFIYVATEMSAALQFGGSMSEVGGDQLGFVAICAPAQSGPLGTVAVSGFMNGCITPGGSRV